MVEINETSHDKEVVNEFMEILQKADKDGSLQEAAKYQVIDLKKVEAKIRKLKTIEEINMLLMF